MDKQFIGYGIDGCSHTNRKPLVFGLMVCDECKENLRESFREDFTGKDLLKEKEKDGKTNDKHNKGD